MAKVRTQPERRAHTILTDRHGRQYSTYIEVDSMDPCAAITPYGWTPPILWNGQPFVAPSNFMHVNGKARFGFIDIRYDEWLAHTEERHRQYDDLVMNTALREFSSAAPEMVRRKDPALMRIVGDPPFPLEPIQAAKQGNKYVLGLSKAMPEWARPFFTPRATVVKQFPDAEEFDDALDAQTVDLDQGDEGGDFDEGDAHDTIGLDDDLEALMDIEEETDPASSGRVAAPPRPKRAHRRTRPAPE